MVEAARVYSSSPRSKSCSSQTCLSMVKHGTYLIMPHEQSREKMGRRQQNQITVELAPKTRAALEQLRESGDVLSIQDFVRRAIDEKLERWQASGHRVAVGPGPADLGRGLKPKGAR